MNKFDTPYVYYEVSGPLLIAHYKKGIRITLDIAKQIVRERLALTGNRTMVALVLNMGVASMDKEARDFFSSPAGNEGLAAGAIVIDSTFTAILGNFFLTVNKPNIPARMFTKESQAIAWLQKFMK